MKLLLFNRPGEVGAVLETPLSLINSLNQSVILFLNIFKTPSLPNRKSKGPDILRECSPPPISHNVKFQVSRVTCNFILDKVFELILEGLSSIGLPV